VVIADDKIYSKLGSQLDFVDCLDPAVERNDELENPFSAACLTPRSEIP
jgi:hypothetical protein